MHTWHRRGCFTVPLLSLNRHPSVSSSLLSNGIRSSLSATTSVTSFYSTSTAPLPSFSSSSSVPVAGDGGGDRSRSLRITKKSLSFTKLVSSPYQSSTPLSLSLSSSSSSLVRPLSSVPSSSFPSSTSPSTIVQSSVTNSSPNPLPDDDTGLIIDDDDESMRHSLQDIVNKPWLSSMLPPSSSVTNPPSPSLLVTNITVDDVLLLHQTFIDKYRSSSVPKSTPDLSLDQLGDIYEGVFTLFYQSVRRLAHHHYVTTNHSSSTSTHRSNETISSRTGNLGDNKGSSVPRRSSKVSSSVLKGFTSKGKNDMAYPIFSPSIPLRYEAYRAIPTVLSDKQFHKDTDTGNNDTIHSRWITMIQTILKHAETVLQTVTNDVQGSSTIIPIHSLTLLTKWNNILLRVYPFLHTQPSSVSMDYAPYVTRIDKYFLSQQTLLSKSTSTLAVVSLGSIRWLFEYTASWYTYHHQPVSHRKDSMYPPSFIIPSVPIHASSNPVIQFCLQQLPSVWFHATPSSSAAASSSSDNDPFLHQLPIVIKHTDALLTSFLHLQYKFGSISNKDKNMNANDKRILPYTVSQAVLQTIIKEMEYLKQYGFLISPSSPSSVATLPPSSSTGNRPQSSLPPTNGLPLSRFILCLRTLTRLQGLGWYSIRSIQSSMSSSSFASPSSFGNDDPYRQKIIDLFSECNPVTNENPSFTSSTSSSTDAHLALPEFHMDARLLARFVTTVEPSNFSSRLVPSPFSHRVAILAKDASSTSWNPEAVARLAAYTSRLGPSAPLTLLRTLRNMTLKFLREGSKSQSGRIFSPAGITAIVHMMRSCKAQDTTFLNAIFDYVATILRKQSSFSHPVSRRNDKRGSTASTSMLIIDSDFTPSQVARLCHVMTSSGIQHTPFLDAVVNTFPPQSFIHASYRNSPNSMNNHPRNNSSSSTSLLHDSDPYNSLTSLLWALVCGGHLSMYHTYIQQIIELLPNKLPILEHAIKDNSTGSMTKVTDIVFPLHLSSLVIDAHNQELRLVTMNSIPATDSSSSSIVPVRNLPSSLRDQVRYCMNKLENNSSTVLRHHQLSMEAFESALTGTLAPSFSQSLPFRGRLMAELIASTVRLSKEYGLPLPQYFVHHPLSQFTIDILFPLPSPSSTPSTPTVPPNPSPKPLSFVQRTQYMSPAVGIQLFHSSWFLPQEMDSRLSVTTPSLLGVSTLFHPSAVSRMYALRQLDPHLEMIIATHRLPNELGTIMNRNLFGSRNAYKLLDNWIISQLKQTHSFGSTAVR